MVMAINMIVHSSPVCDAMHVQFCIQQLGIPIIGASLSEPHTSMAALRTCLCIHLSMLAWTDHLPKILNISAFKF